MSLNKPESNVLIAESDWLVSDKAAVAVAIFTGILVLISGGAFWYAVTQVGDARRQMRGQFLFELEARWTSRRMEDGQKELIALIQQVKTHVQTIEHGSKYPNLKKMDRDKRNERLYSISLSIIRQHDKDRYRKIKNILEFFETIGVIIYKIHGLDIDAVSNLLAGPIESIDRITRRHIEQTRGYDPKNKGFYEHATRLFDDTKQWLAGRRKEWLAPEGQPNSAE